MKDLRILEVRFEFAARDFDWQCAGCDLLPLLEHVSICGSSPWRWTRWSADEQKRIEIVETPTHAFGRVAEGDWQVVNASREWRHPDGPGWTTENIGMGERINAQGLSIGVAIVLADPEVQESTFVALCELLQPRHGLYVPNYYAPMGFQNILIEAALERDYAMYRNLPDSPEAESGADERHE